MLLGLSLMLADMAGALHGSPHVDVAVGEPVRRSCRAYFAERAIC